MVKIILLVIFIFLLFYILNNCNIKNLHDSNIENFLSKKNDKFLIYKGTGGLVHLLSGLVMCIEYCNKNNFDLIIDVKNHKAFGVEFKKIFKLKNIKFRYYEDYSVIPDNYTYKNMKKEEIKNTKHTFIKSKYSYFLKNINISKLNNKHNLLVFAGTNSSNKKDINKYIKLNSKFKKKILKKNIPFDDKYVSIHFRNTDKKNDFNEFKKKIIFVNQKYKIFQFFIATDDYEALKKFKSINEKNIFKRITIPNKNIKNLHYSKINKFKHIMNLMTDMYFILKSDYFIPSKNSGVSKLLKEMINSRDNFFDIYIKTKLIDKI